MVKTKEMKIYLVIYIRLGCLFPENNTFIWCYRKKSLLLLFMTKTAFLVIKSRKKRQDYKIITKTLAHVDFF